MKWRTLIPTLALLAIIRVTSAGTVVLDNGAQLIVTGPALPHIGEAEVSYHDCTWYTLWTVCQATITQDGVSYEAVQ